MKRRRPTQAELQIWARVARTVKPLDDQAAPHVPPNKAEPPQAGAEPAVPTATHQPPQAPVRARRRKTPPASPRTPSPANRGGERGVRRGQVDIAARFDLHGHTQASADRALKAFLGGQQRQGARCVLVITGKGREGDSVLRRNFLHWLETPEAHHLISGWSEAHARHGGHGAFYVFLRRQTR